MALGVPSTPLPDGAGLSFESYDAEIAAYSDGVKRRRRLAFSTLTDVHLAAGGPAETVAFCADSQGFLRTVAVRALLAASAASLDSIPSFEWHAHCGGANSIVPLPGAAVLASGGGDGFVRLWEYGRAGSGSGQPGEPRVVPGELLRGEGVMPAAPPTAPCGGAPDNQVLSIDALGSSPAVAAGCADGGVHIVDVGGGAAAVSRSLWKHSGAVVQVAAHPSSPHTLASASEDGSVRIWDLRASDACTTTFRPSSGHVVARPPSAGAAAGAAPSARGTAPGSQQQGGGDVLPGGALTCCAWDVSGYWLLGACRDGSLGYYSSSVGAVLERVRLPAQPLVLKVMANEVYVGVDAPVLHYSDFMSGAFRSLPLSVPCTTAMAIQPRAGASMGIAVLGSVYGSMHILSSSSYAVLSKIAPVDI